MKEFEVNLNDIVIFENKENKFDAYLVLEGNVLRHIAHGNELGKTASGVLNSMYGKGAVVNE